MSRKVHSARPFIICAIIFCIFACFFSHERSFGSTGAISNIFIAREGDAPGSNIVLSWQISGVSAVDIWTKIGDFDAKVGQWTLEPQFTDISGTSAVDRSVKVGDGKNKWYKIVPHGTVIDVNMITQEVLGKFDYLLDPGDSMISLPLEPFSSDINAVIGGQLTGGTVKTADKIQTYKSNSWKAAYLTVSGNWQGPLKTLELDQGYWIIIRPQNKARTVTIVGKTVASDRKISLEHGYNLIGTAYPVAVPLKGLGLTAKQNLTEGNASKADKIMWRNGASYDTAYLSSTAHSWKGDRLTALIPGRGYYVTKRSPGSVEFRYKKPY